MRVPAEFEGNNLWMTEEAWFDLTNAESPFSLSTVKSIIIFTLERKGAFIIHKDDVGIMRRFDRASEFEAFMNEVEDKRRQKGLKTSAP